MTGVTVFSAGAGGGYRLLPFTSVCNSPEDMYL